MSRQLIYEIISHNKKYLVYTNLPAKCGKCKFQIKKSELIERGVTAITYTIRCVLGIYSKEIKHEIFGKRFPKIGKNSYLNLRIDDYFEKYTRFCPILNKITNV